MIKGLQYKIKTHQHTIKKKNWHNAPFGSVYYQMIYVLYDKQWCCFGFVFCYSGVRFYALNIRFEKVTTSTRLPIKPRPEWKKSIWLKMTEKVSELEMKHSLTDIMPYIN